jgi:hypothetical protein
VIPAETVAPFVGVRRLVDPEPRKAAALSLVAMPPPKVSQINLKI